MIFRHILRSELLIIYFAYAYTFHLFRHFMCFLPWMIKNKITKFYCEPLLFFYLEHVRVGVALLLLSFKMLYTYLLHCWVKFKIIFKKKTLWCISKKIAQFEKEKKKKCLRKVPQIYCVGCMRDVMLVIFINFVKPVIRSALSTNLFVRNFGDVSFCISDRTFDISFCYIKRSPY